MRFRKVELLAPAGSPEAYRAAAAAGADAVYLGAKAFNARAQAQNFDDEQLSAVIDDAHERGMKAYLVLNTLIREDEVQEAAALASFVYQQGIDAIIVQDLGLVRILKEIAPDLAIHASTQMTLHNTDGVEAARKLGIRRVVLARELSLQEIGHIAKTTDAELEVFVHGALCVSRSGQCLLSGFIGGRSGNRGRCAQPCRLPWQTVGAGARGKYLLSPRDLMTLELLPGLIGAGVTALKIEGRLKSAEYVAAVVSVYRKYLDMALNDPSSYRVDPKDIHLLERVFNRGGFTKGYLRGKNFRQLMSTEHPKHQGVPVGTVLPPEGNTRSKFGGSEEDRLVRVKFTAETHMGDGLEIRDEKNGNPSAILSVMLRNGAHVKTANPGETLLVGNFKTDPLPGSPVYKTYDRELMESLSGLMNRNIPRVPVRGHFNLFAGQKPVFEVSDEMGNRSSVCGEETAQAATNKPITADRVREQLSKTGDTPYFFDELQVKTDNHAYVPISVINDLRRRALEMLSEKRRTIGKKEAKPLSPISYFPGNSPDLTKQREISLYFYKIPEGFTWEGLHAHRAYLPITGAGMLDAVKAQGIRAYIRIPPILTDDQVKWYVDQVEPIRNRTDGVLVGNLGMLHRMRENFPDLPVCLDFQMNLFNAWAIEALRPYAPESAMLSVELNLESIARIKSPDIPLEAYIYGEIPVMTLEYCPASGQGSCTRRCDSCSRRSGYLTDRLGKRFQYEIDPFLGRTTLYNSSRLMLQDVRPLRDTDVCILRIGVMHESARDVQELCRFYHRQWVEGQDEAALGEPLLSTLKGTELTKGHFHRGVE